MRILKPVLEGHASSVEIKREAEDSYVDWMQEALRDRVWNSGCQSVGAPCIHYFLAAMLTTHSQQWYLNDKRWNSMGYPWTQGHYWYRSLFPVWSDWKVKVSNYAYPMMARAVLNEFAQRTVRRPSRKFRIFGLLALVVLGNLYAAGLQSPLVKVTALRVWDSMTTCVRGIMSQ